MGTYLISIKSLSFPEFTSEHRYEASSPVAAAEMAYSDAVDEKLKHRIPHPGQVDNHTFDWDSYYKVEFTIKREYMKIWAIKGESNDWCGISECYIYHSDILDSEKALEKALQEHGDSMDEALWEHYTQDEDDEDYIEEPSYSYQIEEWTEERYGDWRSGAYQQLN